jgi:alpha-D-ribose 1-methylphosphonate 5-triphosphate synthase subunit PhnG
MSLSMSTAKPLAEPEPLAKPEPTLEPDPVALRRHWMAVLALSPESELEGRWQALADKPPHRDLRAAELGTAMVRGRVGGTGEPFNLGEMTMTRAAVQLIGDDGATTTGFGHVAGRRPRHAELAALFDAMLQLPARQDAVLAAVIAPLAAAIEARRAAHAAAVAPSRVEFFTMVRER